MWQQDQYFDYIFSNFYRLAVGWKNIKITKNVLRMGKKSLTLYGKGLAR